MAALLSEKPDLSRMAWLPHLSSEMVQPVLDCLPMPVFFKDRAGIYRGCNAAFAAMLGHQPADLIGRSVHDLSPPDLAHVYAEADEALMQAGTEQRYEAQVELATGERRDVIFYKCVLRDPSGAVAGLIGTVLDITERKEMEQQLAELARQDALTGLLNRRAILDHLASLHADRRSRNRPVCLMMCDVDHFKAINDRWGHAAGDEVLRQVAHSLRQNLRDGDVVGRIGGEEFLVVLDSTELEPAREVAERLRQVVAGLALSWQDTALPVTLSIGVAQSPRAVEDWSDLMSWADEALYAAKRAGRDRVVVLVTGATGPDVGL